MYLLKMNVKGFMGETKYFWWYTKCYDNVINILNKCDSNKILLYTLVIIQMRKLKEENMST